jgi:hypothetical protein
MNQHFEAAEAQVQQAEVESIKVELRAADKLDPVCEACGQRTNGQYAQAFRDIRARYGNPTIHQAVRELEHEETGL